MNVPRTKFLDYDARRAPKTRRYCICCGRDIKPTERARTVAIAGFPFVTHPEDRTGTEAVELIGASCAKHLGLEWSVPERAKGGQ